jgi:hypothetical protein
MGSNSKVLTSTYILLGSLTVEKSAAREKLSPTASGFNAA